MNADAEVAVKKLSRLPSNQICANCGTAQRHGFNTVCIKYYTFVCNLCKTAHQAVSHRCKSLTMSTWDTSEVLKLKKHGNDYARRVWLANAPEIGQGGRPREGDHVDVFKRFVVAAYDQKRYYQEDSQDDSVSGPLPKKKYNRKKTVTSAAARVKKMSAPAPALAPAPAARVKKTAASAPVAPVMDLLDFTSNPLITPTGHATQDFADFSQTTAPPTASTTQPQTTTLDLFGDDNFHQQSSAVATETNGPTEAHVLSMFDQLSITPATSETANKNVFDPFSIPSDGGTSTDNLNMLKQQSCQPKSTPTVIMNHNINVMPGGNNSNASNMISKMGMDTGGFGTVSNGVMMNKPQGSNIIMKSRGFTLQQQVIMMQQQNYGNNNGMTMSTKNGIMNNGMGISLAQQQQQQQMMMQQQMIMQQQYNGNGMMNNAMMAGRQKGGVMNNGMYNAE